uniref:Uncharacterized protein n=1 Tax=Oryza sativa subsp. japonica TaxID=39947 RepID=Q6K4T3_ORYSJ|nr:hypothetical protein [Oryza sativa Japonica Group]BAD22199.1 hypothetical protein [Oryza sativa Japonica Group]
MSRHGPARSADRAVLARWLVGRAWAGPCRAGLLAIYSGDDEDGRRLEEARHAEEAVLAMAEMEKTKCRMAMEAAEAAQHGMAHGSAGKAADGAHGGAADGGWGRSARTALHVYTRHARCSCVCVCSWFLLALAAFASAVCLVFKRRQSDYTLQGADLLVGLSALRRRYASRSASRCAASAASMAARHLVFSISAIASTASSACRASSSRRPYPSSLLVDERERGEEGEERGCMTVAARGGRARRAGRLAWQQLEASRRRDGGRCSGPPRGRPGGLVGARRWAADL